MTHLRRQVSFVLTVLVVLVLARGAQGAADPEAGQAGGTRPKAQAVETVKLLQVIKTPRGGQAPTDALDLAIAGSNDRVYVWYADGTASSGSSGRLDRYRTPYPYSLPPGKSPADIVGVAIAGSNDHVYAWYSDGTMSSGKSGDLDAYRPLYPYSLAPGKTRDQIAAIAIAGSNDHVYVWYDDGTASSGTITDLDAYRAPYPYTLAPGRTPADILGMGIASNDHVYAWYRDGTVSAGTTSDLDAHRAPYLFRQHLLIRAWWGPPPRRAVSALEVADLQVVGKFPVAASAVGAKAADLIPLPKEPDLPAGDPELTLARVPEALLTTDLLALGQSPPLLGTPFDTGLEGVDPMIAVGRDYVVVSQQGSVRFLDRNGAPLPAKDGVASTVYSNQLFAAFLTADSPADINDYIGFPKECDGPGYPDTAYSRKFCVNQAYDLRVLFDASADRFIVFGNMRNPLWTDAYRKTIPSGDECGSWKGPGNTTQPIEWSGDNDDNWCLLAHRHVALAVSKTQDPRDGFYLYALTENNYRDFPWATINGDSLVIAHRGREMPDGPVATVLSLTALRSGSQRPPYFRYYRGDLEGNHPRVLLPVHHGSPGGLTLMYATGTDAIRVFGFPPPAHPYAKPPLTSVRVEVDPMFPAVYRDGFLYFATSHDTGLSPNATPRNNIKTARVSLTAPGGQLAASTSPAAGYRAISFGKDGPGDAPGDIVSYERTTLAVTKNGDVVLGYGRSPVATQSPLFPEVRYTVWYGDEAKHRRSRVLKKGTAAASETPNERMDYAWAVVDPVDDETVWIAHEYSAGSYKMVVGKVKP